MKTLTKTDLKQFTGSETWYRHPFNRKVLFTDGAKHVADAGGAYWLIDIIASVQHMPEVAKEGFQLWKLTVTPKQTGTVTCEDGNGNAVYTQELEYTDFPLDEIALYFTNNTILLPSEY